MQRGDGWVIGIVLFIGVSLLLWRYLPSRSQRVLLVQQDQRLIQRYELKADQKSTFRVPLSEGWATIETQQGAVRLREHTEGICPREICKHTGWIRRDGESIICIPRRLVISIVQKEKRVDGIAR